MPLITKSVTVAVLVMTLAALGCGGTFSSPGGGPLALIPSGATKIEQWDVAMLLNEEGPLVKGFEDQWETVLEEFGIFIDDLDTLTRSWSVDGVMVIAEGDLDFEDIRDTLHDIDFEERTWRGFELWEGRSSARIRAMAVLEDEGYAVVGTTTDVVREVLKSIDRETGFLSSEQKSAQDMKRAWDKTGSGVLREAREECRVEVDIRGCQASAFAVNFPVGDGTSTVEATAVFLFRNGRTAESQANRMGEFYQEAQESNPSWSPPVSLPMGGASYAIEIGDPEVDGEFAILPITFAVEGEGSRDDQREPVVLLTPRAAGTETASTTSLARKVTQRVAVPSTPETNEESLIVPVERMDNYVGGWVTVKGKLDDNQLSGPVDTALGKIYWLSSPKHHGILIRHEHGEIVPEEFANWLFYGNGTVCVSGRVSRSYEWFTNGEVLVNPTLGHHIRIGC